MNNIIQYNEFINESLFSSRFRFLYDRIKQIIKTANPDDITFRKYEEDGTFSLRFSFPTAFSENDPYGEEETPNDMIISIQRYRGIKSSFRDFLDIPANKKYRLIVNNEEIPITNSEARSLYMEIENRKKMENVIKKKKAQDDLYNKYKELDDKLQKKIK